jgi:nucleotide-binding universal stress UspA family protein
VSQPVIVVGVDPSEHAQLALRWAAAQAHRSGARLRVVHVVDTRAPLDPQILAAIPIESSDADTGTTVEQWLDRVIADLANTDDIDAEPFLRQGSASAALLELADHADLLVVGSRGRGGIAGALLGSTAQQVTGHARVPVVVVRAEPHDKGAVVVGTDGSEHADRAVDIAFEQARLHHATLRLVHAWSPSFAGTLAPSYQGFDDRTVTEEHAAAEEVVKATAARVMERDPDVAIDALLTRDPAARFLIEASSDAALVVVGSRGHGGFASLVLGSVSSAVLHHADCPVMVVP